MSISTEQEISIDILLFARAAELAGQSQLQLTVPKGSSIEEIQGRVVAVCPDLENLVGASRWAVNEEFVELDFAVEASARIALIPPVSGG